MKLITLTKIGVALLGGLAMALGAEAAEPQSGGGPVANLTQVQGTVLVNHGKDYVTARLGTPLSPGARILTMDKSSASVTYKGSCVKQLKENGLLVVQGPADCDATGAVKSVGPFYAAAIGSEIRSDASAERNCDAKDKDGKDRCCACCEKDKEEERDQCCEKEKADGIKGGCCDTEDKDERDRRCKTRCVVAFWPAAGPLAVGAAIFGAGAVGIGAVGIGAAVVIVDSERNERGVSPQ